MNFILGINLFHKEERGFARTNNPMLDANIRHVLLKTLDARKPGTLVIEELGLCQGNARIDIAVINCLIHGYEIKSERDTLQRLPSQRNIYNSSLDRVTVVTSTCHLAEVEALVPTWWGLSECNYKNQELKIQKIRTAGENPSLDPNAVVQLLWRNEALDILKEQNLHHGITSKPREVLWNRLVSNLSLDKLRAIIRKKIKERQYWRSDSRQK